MGDKEDGATSGSDTCIGIKMGGGERGEPPPESVFRYGLSIKDYDCRSRHKEFLYKGDNHILIIHLNIKGGGATRNQP